MTTDRLLAEDILATSHRRDMISKLEKYLQNVRYTTAEWIVTYLTDYIESGQSLEYLSIRAMLEKMAEDLKFTETV